jgi:hypothetical protein
MPSGIKESSCPASIPQNNWLFSSDLYANYPLKGII